MAFYVRKGSLKLQKAGTVKNTTIVMNFTFLKCSVLYSSVQRTLLQVKSKKKKQPRYFDHGSKLYHDYTLAHRTVI